MGDIVILATQATELGNGDKTGAWAEEIAEPYYEFKEAGYKVTLATLAGGKIPIDEVSIQGDAKTPTTAKFLNDEEAQRALNNSTKLSDLDPSSILALFAVGGHGAAVDFPKNQSIAKLISSLYKQGFTSLDYTQNVRSSFAEEMLNDIGTLTSAVCHGVVSYASAVDDQGVPIVKGKKVTGFSDSEEKAVGKVDILEAPETILKRVGATYSKAASDWGEYTQIDSSGSGPIVTGQNPGSSAATAKAVIAVLQRRT